MAQKSQTSYLWRIERRKSLGVPPKALTHKSRQSCYQPFTSHCPGGDFMVSSQFRQKRQRRVLASWDNNGVGYKKISKTCTMKKIRIQEESNHTKIMNILNVLASEPLKMISREKRTSWKVLFTEWKDLESRKCKPDKQYLLCNSSGSVVLRRTTSISFAGNPLEMKISAELRTCQVSNWKWAPIICILMSLTGDSNVRKV